MLKLFNTFSNNKKTLDLSKLDKLNIYVCGVTTSDNCHIGHARTFYFFDILVNYLNYINYNCNYVRNITDIDDKIFNRSNFKNIFWKILSEKMILSMLSDFKCLGLKDPNFQPKVSDYVSDIIYAVNFLFLNNLAYLNKGDVYFSYKKFFFYNENFNFFNVNKYSYGKDFVIWKKNKSNDINGWNSPWGLGRPGWHISCSVISSKLTGNFINIHGGGRDLIFPHHVNEFILSKCLYKNFSDVNFWIHTGLVYYKNYKLSKSNNNSYLIKDILKLYSSDVIKYYLISVHYRKDFVFNIFDLDKIKVSLNKIYLCLENLDLNVVFKNYDVIFFMDLDKKFFCYINDDLNIPLILKLIWFIYHKINKLKYNKDFFLASKYAIKLLFYSSFLGLFSNYICLHKRFNLSENDNFSLVSKINNLINLRKSYRLKKDWVKADYYKSILSNLDVELIDEKNFVTRWYFKN